MDVTIVIPVGPGHEVVAQRAIASAQAQTVPAAVITARDGDGHGAGWARNRGLEQVTTPWVMFLDADDWLEPDAIERLAAVARANPGRYVYSDWYAGEVRVEAPPTGFAWCGGTWHAVTALLPTAWVKDAGGFDESLPGGEDTDLYLNLITSRRCGVRVEAPLLHYSADGQRGKTFVNRPDFEEIMRGIRDKYAERGREMACCGQTKDAGTPIGERQAQDVLAMALWGGNRREFGRATGRVYPRTGNGKLVWVDPADIAAAPQMWRKVEDDPLITPPAPAAPAAPVQAENVQQLADQAMRVMGKHKSARYQPPRAPQQPVTGPDVANIIRMGVEALDHA